MVTGVADVIVAWNVLEHFWPYWGTVAVDWTAELDAALRDALDDRTLEDHMATLQRLGAAAPDGHSQVACPGAARRAKLPLAVDVIEGQIVVTASADSAILRGDVIVSIAGRPAATELAAEEALTSGSPQFKRVKACSLFGAGPSGPMVNLRVRRGGIELPVVLIREDKTLEEFSHPAIDHFSDGIYYVDLSRATMAEIDAMMAQLASAPAVVFDVRRRPNSNQAVLSYLLTRPDDAKTWLAVPHVIRPDHGSTSILSWETSGWEMPVLQPHIGGRIAFLTGPSATSYSESVMGLVEHYHLGAIIGSATAGANGNIAQIAEPTGCSLRFTGLRVTKLDGSRFHLIGVQPTIPASRTIAGVLAGRDEVLKKALVYLRGSSK